MLPLNSSLQGTVKRVCLLSEDPVSASADPDLRILWPRTGTYVFLKDTQGPTNFGMEGASHAFHTTFDC